jgi:hypothetical protein
MLKKYKNQLAELITSLSLPVNNLSVVTENESSGSVTYIRLKDHPLYFGIIESQDSFDSFKYKHVRFSPGLPETTPQGYNSTFSNILNVFERWVKNDLNEYLNEAHIPDMLEGLLSSNGSFSMNTIDFNSNELFTFEERRLLKVGLEEIKTLVKESLNLTEGEFSILNSRIDYLEEASDRLNKFDWKGVLISTVLSIITTLTLDTEKGRVLYDLFSKVLENLPKLN